MYRENEYWDIGYDEKKIQMKPSCGESLFTQPKKKSEKESGGESPNPPLYFPIIQIKHSHAPFLYKKQAKKNENSRSIGQSFDWTQNR